MTSDLKLYYFGARARAEISRLVLAAAKVDYDFVKVERGDGDGGWAKLKPKTPFGQLPVLEKDGKFYAQGIAIQTFLAREYGLYGNTNLECLEIDQISMLREDLLQQESRNRRGRGGDTNPEAKAEQEKELFEKIYPRFLGYFTNILNQAGTGYAIDNRLTLADLVLFEATTTLSTLNPDLLNQYPEVAAHREKIAELDGVKEYLASRETTRM